MVDQGPDYAVMSGKWNPSMRCWSGKWHMHRTPDIRCDFSYSPKVDSSFSAPCEKCGKLDNEKHTVCLSCDAAIHIKCAANALPTNWTCAKCSELAIKYGQIPPLSKYWLGHFFFWSNQQKPVPVEDKFHLTFEFNQTIGTNNILAKVMGSGENHFGRFKVEGILRIDQESSSNASYQVEIAKRFTAAELENVSGTVPLTEVLPTFQPAPIAPIASMSTRRRRRVGEDGEDGFGADDGGDDANRERKRSRAPHGRALRKRATFVTFLGPEFVSSALVAVWREVCSLNETAMNVVCLSGPSSTLPLRSLLRSHPSNEHVLFACKSPATVASCSAACTAVDMAMDNRGGAVSCAATSDKGGLVIFPAALAAAYAVDRFGRSVGVLDLCPQQSPLNASLQGVKGIVAVSSIREIGDRSWRDAVAAMLSIVRSQSPDFLVVSTVLTEMKPMDYAWATDAICQQGMPFVIIVEDVKSNTAPESAKHVMDAMARFFVEGTEASPMTTPFGVPTPAATSAVSVSTGAFSAYTPTPAQYYPPGGATASQPQQSQAPPQLAQQPQIPIRQPSQQQPPQQIPVKMPPQGPIPTVSNIIGTSGQQQQQAPPPNLMPYPTQQPQHQQQPPPQSMQQQQKVVNGSIPAAHQLQMLEPLPFTPNQAPMRQQPPQLSQPQPSQHQQPSMNRFQPIDAPNVPQMPQQQQHHHMTSKPQQAIMQQQLQQQQHNPPQQLRPVGSSHQTSIPLPTLQGKPGVVQQQQQQQQQQLQQQQSQQTNKSMGGSKSNGIPPSMGSNTVPNRIPTHSAPPMTHQQQSHLPPQQQLVPQQLSSRVQSHQVPSGQQQQQQRVNHAPSVQQSNHSSQHSQHQNHVMMSHNGKAPSSQPQQLHQSSQPPQLQKKAAMHDLTQVMPSPTSSMSPPIRHPQLAAIPSASVKHHASPKRQNSSSSVTSTASAASNNSGTNPGSDKSEAMRRGQTQTNFAAQHQQAQQQSVKIPAQNNNPTTQPSYSSDLKPTDLEPLPFENNKDLFDFSFDPPDSKPAPSASLGGNDKPPLSNPALSVGNNPPLERQDSWELMEEPHNSSRAAADRYTYLATAFKSN